jgi:hypothetical protein
MKINLAKIIKTFIPYGIVKLWELIYPQACLFLRGIFSVSKIKDYRQIPIVINNRNHFDYLLRLIEFLEKSGYVNIIILDNDSTYPPLLEYYKNCNHRIIFLNKNLGHRALNRCNLYDEIKKDYYVYTDPDVLPIEECPPDFLKYFLDIMKKNYFVQKIGFGLKIDDLPDYYIKKQSVLSFESQYWKKEVMPGIYNAMIDTTFALHRSFVKSSLLSEYVRHYRTGYPYLARHLPWYEDSTNYSEGIAFYYKNALTSNNW